MPKRSDFLASFFAGVAIAIFLVPFIFNNLQNRVHPLVGSLIALTLFPGMSLVGLVCARFLSRFYSPFWRIAKFIQIGVLNTAIDIGTFNIFIILTGTTSGILIGGVNAPGFLIAVANSYLWNKFWVFSETSEKHSYSDFLSFFVVSFTSLFVNSTIVIVLTTYVSPLFGLSAVQWANLAKLPAAISSFIWNFTGYRLFVFTKPQNQIQNGANATR